MHRIVISATGLYTAPHTISNEELVAAYNSYARLFNETNATRIVAGEVVSCAESSVDFIEKASGITPSSPTPRRPARSSPSTGTAPTSWAVTAASSARSAPATRSAVSSSASADNAQRACRQRVVAHADAFVGSLQTVVSTCRRNPQSLRPRWQRRCRILD